MPLRSSGGLALARLTGKQEPLLYNERGRYGGWRSLRDGLRDALHDGVEFVVDTGVEIRDETDGSGTRTGGVSRTDSVTPFARLSVLGGSGRSAILPSNMGFAGRGKGTPGKG